MKQMFLTQTAHYEHVGPGEGRTVHKYQVDKVIGSTDPKIGDILAERQVADYCEQRPEYG